MRKRRALKWIVFLSYLLCGMGIMKFVECVDLLMCSTAETAFISNIPLLVIPTMVTYAVGILLALYAHSLLRIKNKHHYRKYSLFCEVCLLVLSLISLGVTCYLAFVSKDYYFTLSKFYPFDLVAINFVCVLLMIIALANRKPKLYITRAYSRFSGLNFLDNVFYDIFFLLSGYFTGAFFEMALQSLDYTDIRSLYALPIMFAFLVAPICLLIILFGNDRTGKVWPAFLTLIISLLPAPCFILSMHFYPNIIIEVFSPIFFLELQKNISIGMPLLIGVDALFGIIVFIRALITKRLLKSRSYNKMLTKGLD